MAKPKHPANLDFAKNLQLLMSLKPELASQMQVAKRIGASQSTVGRILRGEVTPSVEVTMSISREFGADINQLYLPHEAFKRLVSSAPPGKSGPEWTGDPDPRSQGLVPIFTWSQAAARPSAIDVREWAICPVQVHKQIYALEVKGLGMFDPSGHLSFREGDRIFVDPTKEAKHRSLAIVQLDNNEVASFRQLVVEEGNWLLVQLNPSLPNRIAPMGSVDRLLGVVVAKVETYD